MNEVNYHGWKKRRAQSRVQRRSVDREERAAIRAARRTHYERLASGELVAPAKRPIMPSPAPSEGPKDIEALTWEEMAAEMRAAGKFVPPKIGEAKLRERVKELRDAEAPEAG